jgi:hypothetical protein
LIKNSLLYITIQFRKNNIFLFITALTGKLLFFTSIRRFEVVSKKKLSLELFHIFLNKCSIKFRYYNKNAFLLRITGDVKKYYYIALLNFFSKLKLLISGVVFINKNAFNGCKLKIK